MDRRPKIGQSSGDGDVAPGHATWLRPPDQGRAGTASRRWRKVAQDGLVLTESQLATLEKAKTEKEAHGHMGTAVGRTRPRGRWPPFAFEPRIACHSKKPSIGTMQRRRRSMSAKAPIPIKLSFRRDFTRVRRSGPHHRA